MFRSAAEVEGEAMIEMDEGGVFSSAGTGPATVATVSEAMMIPIASNSKPFSPRARGSALPRVSTPGALSC
jgi:hypothetical protein